MNIALETNIEPEEILEFLEKINDDVFPPLDSRISLNKYAEKIALLADCLIIRIDKQIEGLAAVYCNDFETKTGYLTLIAVSRLLRNKGIASKLFEEMLRHVKAIGMKKLSLETSEQNKSAVKLYLKYGFEKTKVNEDGSIYMDYRF